MSTADAAPGPASDRPIAERGWGNALAGSNALLAMTVLVIVAFAGLVGGVGADARWLSALGRVIVHRQSIPTGVPFAAASSSHWPNVLVLAEVVFWEFEHVAGDRGLMLAQLLAVGIAFAILARDARAGGARTDRTAVAMVVAAVGAVSSLAIARVQLFSLALFPLLVMLLRDDARRPSRRIWLVVPVFAIWSNLHGAVLVGLLITSAYLALARARIDRATAIGVAIASIGALCLTPSFLRTFTYYHGVLTNAAAQRGVGLWQPLSFDAPFDDLAIVAAVFLLLPLRRVRPPVWELVVIGVLAAASVHTSRSAVWLMFFLVGPASRTMSSKRRTHARFVRLVVAASVLVLAWAIVRGPVSNTADRLIATRAVSLARGAPVLAPDNLGERVVLDGGRIWVGNPLDAFSHRDQNTYVGWLQGRPHGREALTHSVAVVLVSRGSATQRLMDGVPEFAAVGGDRKTVIYRRTR